MKNQAITELIVSLPGWVVDIVDWEYSYAADDEKMALVLQLAQANVENKSGGPFAAAIFNQLTGKVLSVGVNNVVSSNNSVLHAEVMAIMFAEQRLQTFSLANDGQQYVLFSSCEPCAMCLGATLWSGVDRMVCAASSDDARAIGFDEGPVFPESYRYLQQAGLTFVLGFCREAAQAILQEYAAAGGAIYNGQK